ncbi:hypothetical protein [Streptomyces sp. NBC_00268]|uniref:hypothetical protein n=1 Tax=Streptomyces sp. NBC_00268 TaxID=2975695 RepID=UPI00225B6475|nr:hypothetical protein [Streptomyces sp. NBC_00268]MCX5190993.1 hypothetical protein [Streptomyces sp. NBC_00268]
MATINEGLVALTELRSDVETHAWQLDEYEHDLATAMRAESGASAHAVGVGLRAVGPEVSHGRLAPVAARLAAILDSPTRAASQDGRELRGREYSVRGLVLADQGAPDPTAYYPFMRMRRTDLGYEDGSGETSSFCPREWLEIHPAPRRPPGRQRDPGASFPGPK